MRKIVAASLIQIIVVLSALGEQESRSLEEEVDRFVVFGRVGPLAIDTEGREEEIGAILRSKMEDVVQGDQFVRGAMIARRIGDDELYGKLLPRVVKEVVVGRTDLFLLETERQEAVISEILRTEMDGWFTGMETMRREGLESIMKRATAGGARESDIEHYEQIIRIERAKDLLRGRSLARRIGDEDLSNQLSMRFIEGMISGEIDRVHQFLHLGFLLEDSNTSDIALLQQLVDAEGILEPIPRRRVDQRIRELRTEGDG